MADIVRRCEDCGAVLPEGTGSRRLYCDACRKLRKKENNHAWHQKRSAREAKKLPLGRHRKVDKPCKECGTMMYGVDPGKMFCDACKKRRYGKSSVDTDTQPGIVKPKEKPKTNHDLLVDDNAAAAAKGMSYGKFKEWQRRQKELKERGEIY